MRYAMRIEGVWRPLLAVVGGATAANSYVEVADGDVRLRFGLLFNEHVPVSEIVSAARTEWPLLAGIGWRLWMRRMGLIGSRQGVVELRLREPRRMHVGPAPLPWRADRVCVSVEDPEGLLSALGPG